jgi:hypothetical protein
MRLEDLLKETKETTNKKLVKKWEDSGILDGLTSNPKPNLATLLDSPTKQKIPEFISPGVYTIEPTSEGIRFNAPTGTSEATAMAYEHEKEKHQEFVMPEYLLNDPEVVGYPSIELQDFIYKWVAEDLPLAGDYSIKDYGAGRGDFLAHLRTRGVLPFPTYYGFEKKESLVLAGKQKHTYLTLVQQDFLSSDIVTDYTICIGTLNEDHGEDKWEYFNKTLNHAVKTTNKAIILVLASNMDNLEGFLDYPLQELFQNLPKDVRFTIDYTRLEDIYKLTVHIGGYNN